MSEVMKRLAKMQVACSGRVDMSSDWAKEGRERGEPIPSAHICIGWAEKEITELEAELAEMREQREAWEAALDQVTEENGRLREALKLVTGTVLGGSTDSERAFHGLPVSWDCIPHENLVAARAALAAPQGSERRIHRGIKRLLKEEAQE